MTQHINFALWDEEIKLCAFCGKIPEPVTLYHGVPVGGWYGDIKVTTPGKYGIGGLIAQCSRCRDGALATQKHQRTLIREWQQTAPRCIQLIPKKPIQLVVRGCCDDEYLATVIREAFDKLPERSRRKIIDYVLSDEEYSVTGKGLRFEALGRWPGMGDAVGMNMDRGHAIRLRASLVKKAKRDGSVALVETIAHELAHSEQHAEGRSFASPDECERDVEARLRGWGFTYTDSTKPGKAYLLSLLNGIIRAARTAKAEIRSCEVPSGTAVNKAISQAKRALEATHRTAERWKGFKG